ncbi:MAG TPA: hypothetical protein VJG30_04530 [Candidatus Nanoarchaeia archaeon]|nr:hypothetical protein [Candidatus Nanoarchaeia archaeon]
MNDIPSYSEDWELIQYIKACESLPAIERLKYVERRIREAYATMSETARRNFLRLRDEEVNDIVDKFKYF